MIDKNSYMRTDLAAESVAAGNNAGREGISYSEEKIDGFTVETLTLDERGAPTAGRPAGTYITITVGKLWLDGDDNVDSAVRLIGGRLRGLAFALTGGGGGVFVCGLGNREITADAIGPLAVRGITVTRHVRGSNEALFKLLGAREISALSPGVVGQTGIETPELIRAAVGSVRPALAVVIDALASRSTDRLAVTVQLCDTGISPGSGIGGSSGAINRDTLGIPVIAIGVPTMVDSSTLVCDACEKAGIDEIPPELERVLENGRSFFVSRGDSDIAVASLAEVIARAINYAFLDSD